MSKKKIYVPLVAAMTVMFLMLGTTLAFASVQTDQTDYAPGSTVTISGDNSNAAGYLSGEAVLVEVSGPNGYAARCEGVADEDGAWSCQVTLWDSLDAVGTYTYTATGQTSGVVEEGTFTDNSSTTIPGANFAWLKNASIGGGTGFDVTVAGTYVCNTSGNAAARCSNPTAVRVELYTSNGTTNTVSGSPVATKNATPTTGSFTTTFEFRTAPGAGQFPILSDAKYDVKATLVATIGTPGTVGADTPNPDVDDDRFGVDNTAPSVAITALVDTGVDVSGTASDATSGIKNDKVDLNLYKDGGTTAVYTSDAPVQGNGSWNKNGVTKPTDPGAYCFVASVEDVAGNTAATTAATSGAHCFTVAPSDVAPSVSSTSPDDGDTDVAVNANISVTFSEAVNVSGAWFTISCPTAHTATVTGGPTTFTLNPDTDFGYSENCTLTIVAAQVADQDSNDPPDNMAADYQFSFTTVANTAPVIDTLGTFSGAEGSDISLTGTAHDPEGDPLTYSWSVDTTGGDSGIGCPITDALNTNAAASVNCNDDSGIGTFAITFSVSDNHGHTTNGLTTVAVSNANPSATPSIPSADVNEGTSFSLSLSSPTDPGSNDTFTYQFDCGSGYNAASTTASRSCPTTDNGSRSVKLKILDDNGGFTEYTGAVTVVNVAPSGTFNTPAGDVNEGSSFGLSITGVTDPSSVDTAAGFEYAFDCGNGSGYSAWSTTASASCPTTDNGTRSVGGKVRDKDLGVSTYTGAVTVVNVAPSGTFNTPAGDVNEGSSFGLSITGVTDPSSVDTAAGFEYAFDCGDGSGYSAWSAIAGASCPTTDNGTRSVGGKVRDKDLGVSTYTGTVTVVNVAPTVEIAPTSATLISGVPFNFTGTATDPSSVDQAAGFFWRFNGAAYTPATPPLLTSPQIFPVTVNSCGEAQSVTVQAKDKDGGESNVAVATVNVYDAQFRPPLTEGVFNQVQKGQVVPVKISVGCGSSFLSGLSPAIQLFSGDVDPNTDPGDPSAIVTESVSNADTTGIMREVDGQYIYNLRVPADGLKGAKYTITVRPFGPGTSAIKVVLQIRK